MRIESVSSGQWPLRGFLGFDKFDVCSEIQSIFKYIIFFPQQLGYVIHGVVKYLKADNTSGTSVGTERDLNSPNSPNTCQTS